MKTMKHDRLDVSVFGIFDTRFSTEKAVERLKNSGFRVTDISVLMPDKEGTREFAHEKHTKAPEAAFAGATAGIVTGGALGWLAGMGALAIPGIGPLVVAGPMMAAMAGASVGGTVGGVSGALVGLGIPEYEAKKYEGSVKDGGILLSVHCETSDSIKSAKQLLEVTGGHDIASSRES